MGVLTKPMLTIIDYGSGNVRAITSIFNAHKVECLVASNVEQLNDVTGIILPGVGSFDYVMKKLNASGLRSRIEELVIQQKIPVLGICVGMQIMGDRSDEGTEIGLGWISGEVKKLKPKDGEFILRLPHMGWNDVTLTTFNPLLDGESSNVFYFLHSYAFFPTEIKNSMATAEYGQSFTCAIAENNIFGTQFHPEKSHSAGKELLLRFAREICA